MKKLLIIITFALLALIVFSACNNSQSIKYLEMGGRWPGYEDSSALIEEADVVFIGKIIDISFAVLDRRSGQYVDEETEERARRLNTLYSIEIISVYKGDVSKITHVKIDSGLKDFRVEEQLKVMEEGKAYDREWGISVWNDHPNPQIGETYLFATTQSRNSSFLNIMNLTQSIYRLQDPMQRQGAGAEERDSYWISPYEIISHFGEEAWNSFYTEWQRSDSIYRTQQTS